MTRLTRFALPLACLALVVTAAGAAAAPQVSRARPHSGNWSETTSPSVFYGTFQVTTGGTHIKNVGIPVQPNQGKCSEKTYVISGPYLIKKAPASSRDTWYVGKGDNDGLQVTAQQGSHKVSGLLDVTFQSPTTASVQFYPKTGCDLFFDAKGPAK